MPSGPKSLSATSFCVSAGNFARSFGDQAPEAPNPSMRCEAIALTRATVSPAGVTTVAGVVEVGGVAALFEDEHPAANATTTRNARARRTTAIVGALALART